jgi:hypothetical protein
MYVDCYIRKRMRNCCLSVEHAQSSEFVASKEQTSLLFSTLSRVFCNGMVGNARKVSISFIFL